MADERPLSPSPRVSRDTRIYETRGRRGKEAREISQRSLPFPLFPLSRHARKSVYFSLSRERETQGWRGKRKRKKTPSLSQDSLHNFYFFVSKRRESWEQKNKGMIGRKEKTKEVMPRKNRSSLFPSFPLPLIFTFSPLIEREMKRK